LREVLSEFLKKSPDEIPISTPFSKQTKFGSGWGFLSISSISHTKDKVLFGWSDK